MNVKLPIAILFTIITVGCETQTQKLAKLDFPLPPQARYTVTDAQFEAAMAILQQNFSSDTNQLAAIISSPCMCGPGLWHLLKDSPRFSVPPRAKGTVVIPLVNGRKQELPTALLQNDTEVANFRAALADLLANNGNLKFRLPTEREFRTFWAVSPFDGIPDPLIVAEGEHYNLIIEFAKSKPFWFDEVKNMH